MERGKYNNPTLEVVDVTDKEIVCTSGSENQLPLDHDDQFVFIGGGNTYEK